MSDKQANVKRDEAQVSETIVLTAPSQVSSCCAPAKQVACCEPSEKDACCGTANEASSGGCGCQ